jgi:dynein heavy chain
LSLNFAYGIAIEGYTSSGKTETTKEAAKSVGKMCFLLNCSSTLTIDSLLKFFKGFVSGGSWTCFDEFDRVPINVISVISQTILAVNTAVR